jgi:hypothetical protein
MNTDEIIKDYVDGNIRPTEAEHDYVGEKYNQIKLFLGEDNVFRSGSFARHTAVTPIHDLDVIWIDGSFESLDHPHTVLSRLADYAESFYRKQGYVMPEITIQSHSVTLRFEDLPGGFSIDLVPAVKADEDSVNEYGQPLFLVPEIIKLNHANRERFYQQHRIAGGEVQWLLTDPKGYIREGVRLDEATKKNYRTTVRIVKSWRGKQKRTYESDWKLKSFHAEQICVQIFSANNALSVAEGLKEFFVQLPAYVSDAPRIEDRAYSDEDQDKFIDEYMRDVTRVSDNQKTLIIDRAGEASAAAQNLIDATDAGQVEKQLLAMTQEPMQPVRHPVTFAATPKPYREY